MLPRAIIAAYRQGAGILLLWNGGLYREQSIEATNDCYKKYISKVTTVTNSYNMIILK